jgi:flagellin
MSDITLSAAVRSNLLSLQNTASLLDTTQTRLATGNKVNSALDNPTSYFTAQSLNSRASDLGNLLDSVGNAIQTIQAANDGITSITKLVESAQATANQAQQLSETVSTAVAAAAGTVTSSSVISPSASGTLTINGQNVSVLATSAAVAGTVTGSAAATVTADGSLTVNGRSYSLTAAHAAVAGTVTSSSASVASANGTLTVNGRNYSITSGNAAGPAVSTGSATSLTGASSAAAAGFVDTNTLSLTGGNFSAVSITFTSGGTGPGVIDTDTATVQDVINEINSQAGSAVASLVGGKLTITGQDNASDIVVGGTNTSGLANANHVAAVAADDATSIAALINADSGADFSASVGTGPDAGKLILTGNTGTTDVDVTATVAGLGLSVANNAHTAAITADDATSIAALINADSGADFSASVGTGPDAGKLILTGNTGTTDVNVTATVAGTGLSVANNAHTAAVTGDDATSLAAKINGTSGIGVTASVGTGADAGKLIITASTITGDVDITATVAGTGLSVGNNLHTAASSSTGPNPARAALIAQYNGLLDQIDQLTADANYNGNNLLAGSSTTLKVLFNEAGTSSLTITGKDASSSGLGLTALGSTAFDTNASITTILTTLKTATDTLRSDASSFGSNLSIVQTRQDFTKAIINTLQTGASNLTLADSNEEAANLLALQTRQSLSTKALSLASQSDQNVLRLLQ